MTTLILTVISAIIGIVGSILERRNSKEYKEEKKAELKREDANEFNEALVKNKLHVLSHKFSSKLKRLRSSKTKD